MKNFALTILLTIFTLHLSAAVIRWPEDTLKCDTFVMKNGIELQVRIVGFAADTFIVQYCRDTRGSKIAPAQIQEIRYATGLVKNRRQIRREARQRRIEFQGPERLARIGLLQLLGIIPVGFASLYAGIWLALMGSGSSFILPILIFIIPPGYLLIKGISNLIKADKM
jgi:hypothetical protein